MQEVFCPACGTKFADNFEGGDSILKGSCDGCYGWLTAYQDSEELVVELGPGSAPPASER